MTGIIGRFLPCQDSPDRGESSSSNPGRFELTKPCCIVVTLNDSYEYVAFHGLDQTMTPSKDRQLRGATEGGGRGWLRVYRKWEWIFMGGRYTILVDGSLRAMLRPGKEAKLALVPGFHRVVGKIDWWRTIPIKVCIEDGQTCTVEIGCTITPLWLPLLVFFLAISVFQPNRYLFLRHEHAE